MDSHIIICIFFLCHELIVTMYELPWRHSLIKIVSWYLLSARNKQLWVVGFSTSITYLLLIFLLYSLSFLSCVNISLLHIFFITSFSFSFTFCSPVELVINNVSEDVNVNSLTLVLVFYNCLDLIIRYVFFWHCSYTRCKISLFAHLYTLL